MDRKEVALDPRHVGVPSGVSKLIAQPMLCLVQTMHVSCTKINTISKRNLISVCLEIVLISTQDRCTVCVEHAIGLEIILATPMELLGDVGQVEGHFGPFGDSVNLNTT
jgi:hypothetical protein